jgi:hypothetical protein
MAYGKFEISKGVSSMRSIQTVLLVFLLTISSGCFYPGISGRVVDSTTGKPIEGALVVAQWTKKHGFGLTYHDLHKIVETLTDKEGKFSLSGTYNPFVEPPEMIIYKEGYIPWRNDSIFPSSNIVKGHEWNDNVTYKLNVFTNRYTYRQLFSFMDYGIKGSGGRETPIFDNLMIDISKKEQDEIEGKVK